MDDDERFDGLYLNVAQTTRGIEPLLDTVFSFLRRKTDFFAGPPGSGEQGTEKAIAKVNEVLQKHAELYRQETSKAAAKKREGGKKKPAPPTEKFKEKDDDDVIEMGSDGQFDASAPAPAEKGAETKPPPPAAAAAASSAEPASKKPVDTAAAETAKGETSDKGGETERAPPPLGNGGTVDGKYVWTQTLSELTVTVPLPENTRGRDLDVVINKKHLKVALRRNKDSPPVVDAPLTKAIICDDSFWTVEDGNRLVVQLQKLNQMEWWDGVCEGDPKIDVTTIQPENSSLNDLDGETRKTVEKMMYDQRQKAMGKPTSEEEEKLAMLEKFKEQHPELDFSNAKIN